MCLQKSKKGKVKHIMTSKEREARRRKRAEIYDCIEAGIGIVGAFAFTYFLMVVLYCAIV